MQRLLTLLILFGLTSCSALAQATNTSKVKLVFSCDCDSVIASRYATQFRDLLAKSPRYAEARETDKDQRGNPTFDWVIYVVAGPADDTPILSSLLVVSVAFTWHAEFRGNYVLSCGEQKLSTCAANTLAFFDKTVHSKL